MEYSECYAYISHEDERYCRSRQIKESSFDDFRSGNCYCSGTIWSAFYTSAARRKVVPEGTILQNLPPNQIFCDQDLQLIMFLILHLPGSKLRGACQRSIIQNSPALLVGQV